MREDGWWETIPLEDLPEGFGKAVEVGPVALLLIRREGEIFATGTYCPHEEVELDPQNLFGYELVCKEHGYRLDVRNGHCANDSSLCLVTYPTEIRSGVIFVKLV